MRTKFFFTGLAFIAITSIAAAQNSDNGNRKSDATHHGYRYTDGNKDGVCDNLQKSSQNAESNSDAYYYQGRHGKSNNNTGNCCGNGPRNGHGKGKGRYYKDSNNNGICDNAEKHYRNK